MFYFNLKTRNENDFWGQPSGLLAKRTTLSNLVLIKNAITQVYFLICCHSTSPPTVIAHTASTTISKFIFDCRSCVCTSMKREMGCVGLVEPHYEEMTVMAPARLQIQMKLHRIPLDLSPSSQHLMVSRVFFHELFIISSYYIIITAKMSSSIIFNHNTW